MRSIRDRKKGKFQVNGWGEGSREFRPQRDSKVFEGGTTSYIRVDSAPEGALGRGATGVGAGRNGRYRNSHYEQVARRWESCAPDWGKGDSR